jgi:transposase
VVTLDFPWGLVHWRAGQPAAAIGQGDLDHIRSGLIGGQRRYRRCIRFLDVTKGAVPKGKAIHAIVDNYAAHKHPKVKAWLACHPRWTFHFTPTSASWLNAVEGFFAKLTKRALKRGMIGSIVDLQAAVNRFLAKTNSDPRPFRWTKTLERLPSR